MRLILGRFRVLGPGCVGHHLHAIFGQNGPGQIVDDDDPGPEQKPKSSQSTQHAELASISRQLNGQSPPDHDLAEIDHSADG